LIATLFIASCTARYYDDLSSHYQEKPIYEPAPSPVNGVPVDTAEVQHEKAQHFAAVHRALSGQPGHYAPAPVKAYYAPAQAHYAPVPVYNNGPSHYSAPAKAYYTGPVKVFEPAPAPVNGVPVDTAEDAKAIHFALYSEARAHHGYNGAPVDTYEVQAEKTKHFALVAQAQSQKGYGTEHEDDGSYDPRKYENESQY
jgi:hypothetical protein